MNQRQARIRRLEAVAEEFRAGRTAAGLLDEQLKADPSYGDPHGWKQRAGREFRDNLEATYIVRLYAEFEAALRDYWLNCLKRDTEPPMVQLVKILIPAQLFFPQDYIDNADEVRVFRNQLVHGSHDDEETDVAPLSIKDVESRLKAYVSRLKLDW